MEDQLAVGENTIESRLIPLSEAAKISGYTAEHLNLLCRKKILRGEKMGRNWYTTKEWLDAFLFSQDSKIEGREYKKRKHLTIDQELQNRRNQFAVFTGNGKGDAPSPAPDPQVWARPLPKGEVEFGNEKNILENENTFSKDDKMISILEEMKEIMKSSGLPKNAPSPAPDPQVWARPLPKGEVEFENEKPIQEQKFLFPTTNTKFFFLGFASILIIFFGTAFHSQIENLKNGLGINAGINSENNLALNNHVGKVAGETTDEGISLDKILPTQAETQKGFPYSFGDLILTYSDGLKLREDSISEKEIKFHAIEARNIDTNSITSRTIKDETIRDRDIAKDINLHVKEVITSEGIEISGLAIFKKGIELTSGNINITGDIIPSSDNLYNLGSAGKTWSNIYAQNISAATMSMSGNLDMQNNLILNIGNASTDFTAGGGLNLAGNLNANAGVDILGNNLTVGGTKFSVDVINGNINTEGNITGGTYNGLTINTSTGTLAIGNLKTFTVNDSATIATSAITLANTKTLTLSDSTTLNTNSIGFAGTESLTLAAAKNVNFADAFSTSGAFPITLTSTNTTSLTLPTTGTLSTLAGAETFTNKVSYNGLVIVANTGEITTGTWHGASIADANVDNNLTIAGGTISGASNTMSLGSDATGDIYYRNSSGYLTRLAVGTSTQVLHGGTTPSYSAIVAADITADSLDFTEFKDAMTLDAPTDVALAGYNFTFSGAGNVGIGTTNPLYKLSTIGTGYFSGDLSIIGDGSVAYAPTASGIYLSAGADNNRHIEIVTPNSTNAYIDFTNPSVDALGRILYNTTNNSFNFYTNSAGSPGMFINSGGNVGVGTTNPGEKLTVDSGNISFATEGQYGIKWPGGSMLKEQTVAQGGVDRMYYKPNGDRFEVLDEAGANFIAGFHGANSSLSNRVILYNGLVIGDGTYLTSAPPTLGAIIKGNVGIGTTNPTTALQVGTILYVDNSTGKVGVGAASTGVTLYVNGTIQGTSIYGSTFLDASDYNRIASNVNGLQFRTTSGTQAERMRIDATGNVGIGTTGPGYKLDLNGTSRFNGIALIDNGGSGSSYQFQIKADIGTTTFQQVSGGTYLNISTSAGSIALQPAGNIGIGTTAPGLKLDVFGSGGAPKTSGTSQYGALRLEASSNSVLDFGITNASPYGNWIQSTDRSALGTNYPLLLNPNGGNVGIGTTAPASKLQIDLDASSRISFTDLFTNFQANVYSADATAPNFIGVKGRGSLVSPTAALANDGLMFIGGRGYPNTTVNAGAIRILASENYSASANGSYITFETTPNTTTNNRLERVRIDNQGNVGIGTTSPSTPLEIDTDNASGSSALKLLNTNTGSSAYAQLYIISQGGGNVLRSERYSGDFSIRKGDGTPMVYFQGAGNVGIGTTNPGYKLYVNGDTYINGALTTTSGLTITGSILPSVDDTYTLGDDTHRWKDIYLGAETLHIGTSVSDEGYLSYTTSTNVLNLQSTGNLSLQPTSGNVGIGTTGPTSNLEVVGGSASYLFSLKNGASQKFLIGNSGTIYAYAGIDDLSGYSDFNLSNGNPILTHNRADSSSALVINQSNNSSTGDLLDLQNQGVAKVSVLNNGNVGIGTTGPGYKLDVQPPNTTTQDFEGLRVFNTNSSGSVITSSGIVMGITNSVGIAQSKIATVEETADGANTSLAFYTNTGTGVAPTEKMRIQANGNVGIGTTAPLSLLHLNGSSPTLTIYDTGATSGQRYWSVSTTGGTMNFNSADNDGSYGATMLSLPHDNAGGDIKFSANGNAIATAQMIIKNSGNVGIGTTAPNFILQAAGSTGIAVRSTGVDGTFQDILTGYYSGNDNEQNAIQTTVSSVAENSGFNFLVSDGGGLATQKQAYRMSRDSHRFYIGGSEKVTINSSGNVGIGTTNPTGLLDVRLPSTNVGEVVRIGNVTTGQFGFLGIGSGTTYPFQVFGATGGALALGANGTEAVRIKSDGNVGIGTTSPGSLLDVYGTAYPVARFTRTNSDGSSYVTANDILGKSSVNMIDGFGSSMTFSIMDDAGVANMIGQIGAKRNGADNTGDLWFQSRSAGTWRDAMVIKNDGNVGIGTTGPGTKLDVRYSGAAGLGISSIQTDTVNAAKNIIQGGDGTTSARYVYQSYIASETVPQRWDVGLYGTKSYTISDVTAGLDRLTITTAGNVGIGTTTPSGKLAVSGGMSVGADYNYAPPTNGLIIQGNVGIGTTAPGANLHVYATTGFAEMRVQTVGSPSGDSAVLGLYSSSVNGNYRNWRLITNGSVNGNLDFDYSSGVGGSPAVHAMSIDSAGNVGIGYSPVGTGKLTINGNVGIGTTNPAAMLHIYKNGNAEIARIEASGTSGYLQFNENGLTRGYFGYGDDGNIFTGASADSLSLRAQGNIHFGGGGNNLVMTITSGNVGIGTTVPLTKLHIEGTAVASGSTTIKDQKPFSLSLLQGSEYAQRAEFWLGRYAEVGNSAKTAMTISLHDGGSGTDADTNVMTLLGSGNVGIGTTSPTGLLNISQSSTDTTTPLFLGSATWNNVNTDFTGFKMNITYTAGSNNSRLFTLQKSGTPVYEVDRDGRMIIQGQNGNSLLLSTAPSASTYPLFMLSTTGANAAFSSSGTYIGINAANGYAGNLADLMVNGVSRFLIQGSGNVGIGTTNPGAMLDVVGGYIRTNQGIRVGSTYSVVWGGTGVSVYTVGDSSNNYFAIGTNASERMRIDNLGNVGIGTTGPNREITLYKATNPTLQIANSTTGSALADGGILQMNGSDLLLGNQENGGLNLFVDNNQGMYIKTGGNVGIGTTGPGQKLEVENDSAGALTFPIKITNAGDASSNAGLLFQIGTGGNARGKGALVYAGDGTTWNRGDFMFLQNSVTDATNPTLANAVMTIKNSGNVGIGTTNPLYKTQINGNETGTFTALYLNNDWDYGVTNAAVKLAFGRSQNVGRILGSIVSGSESPYSSDNGYMAFNLRSSASETERVRITNAGNVGIGTTGPGTKLHVVGVEGSWRGQLSLESTGAYDTTLTFYNGPTNQVNEMGVISYRNTDKIFDINNYNYGTGGPITFSPNGEKVRITSSGNVGIGTTGPGYKLQVAGGDINVDATNGYYRVGGDAGLYGNGSTYIGVGTSGSRDLQLWAGGSAQRVTILNSTGNVGIGTTGPGNLLHVYQNAASATPLARLQQANTGGYATLQIDRASTARVVATSYSTGGTDEWYTGELYNGGSPSTKFSIATGNSLTDSKLVIQTDGNVGIGTATPLGTQHIQGTSAGATIKTLILENHGATEGSGSAIYMGYQANATTPYGIRLKQTGYPSSTYSGDFSIQTHGGSAGDAESDWDTRFFVGRAGNVGIGTTNPGAKLQIDPGTGNSISLMLSEPGYGTAYGYKFAHTVADGRMELMGINNSVDKSIMTFKRDTGNVGIGTGNSIDGRLEILATSPSAGATNDLFIDEGNVIGKGNLRIGVETANHTSFLQAHVWATGYTSLLLNPLGGAVGIGTTGPMTNLHVAGAPNGDTASIRLQAFSPNYYTDIIDDARGSGSTVGTVINTVGTGGTGFQIQENGTPRLYVKTGGNVGIGTTSPGAKLHVSGGAILLDNNQGLQWKNHAGSIVDIIKVLSVNSDVAFYRGGGVEVMRIANSENVGIGTTGPSRKLFVNGDAGGTGAWNNDSYSGYKENFADTAVLDKIMNLNIKEWQYKASHLASDVSRHLSPFSEDFRGQFGLGQSDYSIQSLDVAGVALKGVQELASSVNELNAKNSNQFNALGNAFYITNSVENSVLFGNREISPLQNRDMTLTADTINLNGLVMANGVDINGSILKLTNNQNAIVNQLTNQLSDQTLTVNEKLNLIGQSLDNLSVEQTETIKDQMAGYESRIMELESQVAEINSKMYVDRFDELWNFYQNFNLDKIALDADGNLTLGGKITAKEAMFEGQVAGDSIAIKVKNASAKTIGEAYICPAGKIFDEISKDCIVSDDLNNNGTFVEVKTTAVSNSAKIFITPENDLGSVWVEKESDNSGFKIRIKPENPITEKAKINWWIVEEK